MKLELTYTNSFVSKESIQSYESIVASTYNTVYNKTGAGNDFLGWVSLPSEIDESLMADIERTASELRKKSDLFVVIGIGGSYLGARAIIEALQNHFAPLSGEKPLIVYAGHNMSEDYLHELMAILDKKDYSLAVISKSGTTTEPAIAFRILKQHIIQKYGEQEAASRIVAITDKAKGALKQHLHRPRRRGGSFLGAHPRGTATHRHGGHRHPCLGERCHRDGKNVQEQPHTERQYRVGVCRGAPPAL